MENVAMWILVTIFLAAIIFVAAAPLMLGLIGQTHK